MFTLDPQRVADLDPHSCEGRGECWKPCSWGPHVLSDLLTSREPRGGGLVGKERAVLPLRHRAHRAQSEALEARESHSCTRSLSHLPERWNIYFLWRHVRDALPRTFHGCSPLLRLMVLALFWWLLYIILYILSIPLSPCLKFHRLRALYSQGVP